MAPAEDDEDIRDWLVLAGLLSVCVRLSRNVLLAEEMENTDLAVVGLFPAGPVAYLLPARAWNSVATFFIVVAATARRWGEIRLQDKLIMVGMGLLCILFSLLNASGRRMLTYSQLLCAVVLASVLASPRLDTLELRRPVVGTICAILQATDALLGQKQEKEGIRVYFFLTQMVLGSLGV